MKTPKWICSKCRQPFTRRWNANRHCNNKHYGAIENIISFTEYIINRKDSMPLNSFHEENNSHPLHVKNHVFLDNSFSANNTRSSNLTNPLDDVIEHELLPYKILDQLAPKYEEMQRILDFLPKHSRTILLGIALSSAINSGNPVDTMNKKLTDYRKAKTRVMMLNDLAVFYGQDKAYIKEFLKFKFKQKEYYRKFNK